MRWIVLMLSCLLCGLALASDAGTALAFSASPAGNALPTGWKPYKMSRHAPKARMGIVETGSGHAFRIRANRAAGAIAHTLDLPATTTLQWRWKVDHSIKHADLSRKSGDDFAARVYVFFDLPRDRLSLMDRMKLSLARHALGHPMPRAALCYVWDNTHPVGTIAPNAYFDKVRTLVLQSGNAKAGQWQTQRRDLKADYRAAFGEPAPKVTGIALATDTDNTGSNATAWFGDIHLTPDAPESSTKESTP